MSETKLHYCQTLPAPWGWHEGDGPVVGFYSKQPAGSRWFSGCKWVVAPGRENTLDPLRTEGAPEAMAWGRIYYECLDVVQGEKGGWDYLAREMMGCTPDVEPPNRSRIEEYLGRARHAYKEVVGPWAVEALRGVQLFGNPSRVGWGSEDAFTKAFRSGKPIGE